MLIVIKYCLLLLCQRFLGAIRENILFINRATLCCALPKGRDLFLELVDTANGWLARLNFLLMSTSEQIMADVQELLKFASAEEINEELMNMTATHIQEMQLDHTAAGNLAYLVMKLQCFFTKTEKLLVKSKRKEVAHG